MGTRGSYGYGNPHGFAPRVWAEGGGATVSTRSMVRASARRDGGRVLEHGLPPRTLTVYLQPIAMAEGHGGGGGMSSRHLVGRVWLGRGEVSMAWQADEGGVRTLGVAPSLQTPVPLSPPFVRCSLICPSRCVDEHEVPIFASSPPPDCIKIEQNN